MTAHPFIIQNDTDKDVRLNVERENRRVDVITVPASKVPVVTNDEGLYNACVAAGLIPKPKKEVHALPAKAEPVKDVEVKK